MEFALAFRMIGALAVIGLVLFAFQYVGRLGMRKRLTLPGGNRLVTVVETTHLPNASSLHVVKIGDSYAVIGRSGSYIAKVADVSDAGVAAWLTAREAPPQATIALATFIARLRAKSPSRD